MDRTQSTSEELEARTDEEKAVEALYENDETPYDEAVAVLDLLQERLGDDPTKQAAALAMALRIFAEEPKKMRHDLVDAALGAEALL